MTDNMCGYCIGKATRYLDGDIVSEPPYEKAVPVDLYDLLRSAIYPSREHAELACQFATEFNPVGFVVLRLLRGE
jgi:hypothetical protein